MTDEALLEALCRDAGVEETDDVLEIGPGMGALTRPLSHAARRVLALEIDRELIPYLEAAFAQTQNVHIVQADVMRVDLRGLLAQEFGEGARVRVAANLPYYITSDILKLLLEAQMPIRSIGVMVQKEVGEKMLAQVGDAQWGPLAILCQYRAQVRNMRDIPAHYFTPQPKVDSSFMRLDMYEAPPIEVAQEKVFLRLVRTAFAMRRKTLLNNLQSGFSLSREVAASLLEEEGLDSRVRGEALTMEQLGRLSNRLAAMK